MDDIKVKIGSGAGVKVKIGNGGGGGDVPPYTGTYTVEPDPYDDIILQVAGKRMLNNVTAQKIPSRSVVNPSGGTTFIVGGIDYVK